MQLLKRVIFLLLFLTILFSSFSFGALKDIVGVLSTNITTLCAVGDNGIVLKSNNYGGDWTSSTVDTTTNLVCSCFAGNDLWVAGIKTGISKAYLSLDGGANWSNKSPTVGTNEFTYDLVFDPNTPGTGIISTGAGPSGGQIRFTDNKGELWQASSYGFTAPLRAVAFSGTTNIFWTIDSTQIYRSTDRGNNWLPQAGNPQALNDIYFVDSKHGFVVGANKTFGYTENGAVPDPALTTWTFNTNFGDANNNGVYFISSSIGWICTGSGKVFKLSIDYGTGTVSSSAALDMTQVYPTKSLTPVNPAPAGLNRIFALDENNVFTVCDNGSIYAVASSNPFSVTSVSRKGATSSPHEAPVGFTGDLIITGNNFQIGNWAPGNVTGNVAFPSGSGVTVNSVTRNSSIQLTVGISIGNSAATGLQTVTVTNIDGSTATGNFTINHLPVISYITPPSGTQGTSSPPPLTVSGDFFQTGITANFGPNISNSITDQTQVMLKINIGIDSSAATGPRIVTFTNPDGGSTSESFTVSSATVPNPTVSSVSPSNVVQGTTNQNLIVSGSNFESDAKATFSGTGGITVNSTTFNSTSQLTVNVSVATDATTGPRSITVTNTSSGGSGSANNLFYVTTAGIVNPTISSVTPPQVFRGTAQIITINGTGFKDRAAVSVNPSSNIIINSNTFKDAGQIEVLLTADSVAALGKREITVTNLDGGHGSLVDAIEIVVEKPPPVITDALCYPNPYNPNAGLATLQFFITQNAVVEISLIDISGTQKMSFTTNATVGYNKLRWDGKDYSGNIISNGVLIGLIKADGKLQNKKFKIMVQNR